MKLHQSRAFLKDLCKLIQKHKITAISGPSEKLSETTKHLEGFHLFFTLGEKKLVLRGGDNFKFDSSITVKLSKTRNLEDDGN